MAWRRATWAGAIEQARLVLLTDVLEHVADDYAMFSELLAAASPGTYFLLTVPADGRCGANTTGRSAIIGDTNASGSSEIWAGCRSSSFSFSHFNSRLYPLVKVVRRLEPAGAAMRRAGRHRFLAAQSA